MKVLKFYATWCGPCKAMTMLMKNMENLPVIEEVDIDQNREMSVQYGIRSVPTLVMLDDDGSEVKRYTGGASDRNAIKEWLEV